MLGWVRSFILSRWSRFLITNKALKTLQPPVLGACHKCLQLSPCHLESLFYCHLFLISFSLCSESLGGRMPSMLAKQTPAGDGQVLPVLIFLGASSSLEKGRSPTPQQIPLTPFLSLLTRVGVWLWWWGWIQITTTPHPPAQTLLGGRPWPCFQWPSELKAGFLAAVSQVLDFNYDCSIQSPWTFCYKMKEPIRKPEDCS